MASGPHHSCSLGEPYDYLKIIDPTGLAWEWLRRDTDYRQQPPSARQQTNLGNHIAMAPSACIARWGCLCVENADLRATDASILWRSPLDPAILRVAAAPCSSHDSMTFDLRHWANRAVIVNDAAGREHILLRGRSGIRLDVIAGTLRDGPVSLRFDMTGSNDIESSLRTLRRFLHVCKTGDASPLSMTNGVPSCRTINALRVHDALHQGASIRDIGIMLFGQARIGSEWRSPGESLKSHCRRLIAYSRHMASGGWQMLLR